MRSLRPDQLPCFTTADEMKPLLKALQVEALANLLRQPADPSVPVDPQLLENEKLFASGDRDAWAAAEFKRILGKRKNANT